MSTINGWPVVAMPSYPVARTVDFTANDVVSASLSAFTGQMQTQNWQASWLEASVQMPPMRDTLARGWIAWLLATQGVNGVFMFGDPYSGLKPSGTNNPPGSIYVAASNQTGYSLQINGGVGPGVLLPGDYIQIGFRLYRVTSRYDGGSAVVSIWPQIRESPPVSTAINTVNTQGLFRLKASTRKWTITDQRMHGLQFEIREAI